MERITNSSSSCCSSSGRVVPPSVKARYRAEAQLFWRISLRLHKVKRHNDVPCGGTFRNVIVRGQPPRQPAGEVELQPSEARVISALVAAGLSGTCAVLGAALAHIDLFGQFRWLATDDLLLALGLATPLMVLEGLLLGPRYDRLLAGAGQPGARLGAVGLQLRTQRVGQLLSGDTLAASLVLGQACFVAAQVVRGRGGVTPPHTSPPASPPNSRGNNNSLSPSSQTPPRQPITAAAATTAVTTTASGKMTPLPMEVGLVLVRESAKELLQRGLVFTFLAAWLTDRAFEAGAEDTLALLPPLAAAGAGVTEVYLTDAVRYGTAAVLTGLLMPLVANEAEAMRLGVASNLALVTVQEQQAQQKRKRQQERKRGRDQQRQPQPQTVASAAAGAVSQSASDGRGGEAEAGAGTGMEATGMLYDEGDDDQEMEALLREYRLVEALERSTSTGPPRLTYGITLLRGLLRFGSVNLAFALTGNLAGTLLASAVPNLLLLAYIRGGPLVLLERSPERPADENKASGSR